MFLLFFSLTVKSFNDLKKGLSSLRLLTVINVRIPVWNSSVKVWQVKKVNERKHFSPDVEIMLGFDLDVPLSGFTRIRRLRLNQDATAGIITPLLNCPWDAVNYSNWGFKNYIRFFNIFFSSTFMWHDNFLGYLLHVFLKIPFKAFLDLGQGWGGSLNPHPDNTSRYKFRPKNMFCVLYQL